VSDPFLDAYQQLQVFVAEGHTKEEVTEYAQQLNRELPQLDNIETAMIAIRAVAAITRDLNGETDDEQG
jgi:cell division septal protein FtsQ